MICSAVLRKEWQPGNVGERIAIDADVQIDKAIAIVIQIAGRHCRRQQIKTHLSRSVGKSAVAIVAEELARRQVTNDKQVFEPIVVYVGKDTGIGLIDPLQLGFGGDIRKVRFARSIGSVVMVKA